MRFKKYIANTAIRTFLHLKSLGVLVFVPFVLIDVLIPVLNYLVYRQYGVSDPLYENILEYTQWLMPFASVWCPLFVLRGYLEEDGNELLYVNPNSNKFADIFCLFLILVLNILIIFSVYTSFMPHMKYECGRVLSVCIFYFGIVYAVSFLTKSTTAALLLIILYTIANLYYGRGTTPNIFIYLSTVKLTKKAYISDYLPLLSAGVFLTAIGVFWNQKKINFCQHM